MKKTACHVRSQGPSRAPTADPGANSSPPKVASVAVVQTQSAAEETEPAAPADKVDNEKKGFLAYFKTKEFYITLALGWACLLLLLRLSH